MRISYAYLRVRRRGATTASHHALIAGPGLDEYRQSLVTEARACYCYASDHLACNREAKADLLLARSICVDVQLKGPLLLCLSWGGSNFDLLG